MILSESNFGRLGLGRQRHARRAAAERLELVRRETSRMRLNLPVRPRWTMRRGALGLDDRDVGPAEAVERRVDAEARAGAEAERVLAREAEVLEVVVGELRVVGHVDEVVEDLLGRAVDR